MLQALLPSQILHDITSTHDSQNDHTIDDLSSFSISKLNAPSVAGAYSQVTRSSPSSPKLFDSDDSEDTSTSDSDAENLFSASSSSSDATSLSLSRPSSACGYYYDDTSDDSDTDQDCDATVTISPSSTKPRSALAPCFEVDVDLNLNGRRPSLEGDRRLSWSTHEPGTPALTKDSFDWETRTLVRQIDTAEDERRCISNRFDEYDDDEYDDGRTNNEDADEEDWPDEMDSDDFPILHTWSHSWIWNPLSSSSSSTALPSILFEPVESLPPDQSSWTPLQDFRFGLRLTVPDHQAYNVRHPPIAMDGDRNDADDDKGPAACAVEWDVPTQYDETLGSSVVVVMSLQHQEAEGVRSLPVITKRRRQAQTQSSLKSTASSLASACDDDTDAFIYRCLPEDGS